MSDNKDLAKTVAAVILSTAEILSAGSHPLPDSTPVQNIVQEQEERVQHSENESKETTTTQQK